MTRFLKLLMFSAYSITYSKHSGTTRDCPPGSSSSGCVLCAAEILQTRGFCFGWYVSGNETKGVLRAVQERLAHVAA